MGFSGLGFGVGDLEFFEEFVEGGAADAEVFGGGGDFVAVAFEGEEDGVAFGGFSGGFEGLRWERVEEVIEFEVEGGDAFGVGHDDGALDAILEFADIAWPGVEGESAEGIGGEREGSFGIFGGVTVEEFVGDEEDIIGAVAEWGEGDDDDGEAEVEIFAKSAIGDGVLEVRIGGGDDAGVAGEFFAGADGLEAFILEEAEEFDLDLGGEFADFVEEEGAIGGGFDEAFALGGGAGEGPFFVAEEFAFEEIFGDGVTIDGDEGLIFLGGALVDGFGDEFFTGARFAEDEDWGGGGGDFADEGEDGLHLGGRADDIFERGEGGRFLEGEEFLFEEIEGERASEDEGEFIEVDGFGEEIVGTGADGLEGGGFFGLAGGDDNFDGGIDGEEFGEEGEAFGGGIGGGREAEIEENEAGLMGGESGESGDGIVGEEDGIGIGEGPFELGADVLVVFDDEEERFHERGGVEGREIKKEEPWPSWLSAWMEPW